MEEFDPSTSYEQINQLFHNRGDGTFEETTRSSGSGMLIERVSHGAVFGDIDNDGDVDIFISDSASPHCTLLRNDGGNDQNYLSLHLHGTVSNRDGIGAQVRIVAGDLVQTRQVRRSYGYMGSNDVRLHVGLGSQAQADSIVVRWPGGTSQTILDIAANQQTEIVEVTQ